MKCSPEDFGVVVFIFVLINISFAQVQPGYVLLSSMEGTSTILLDTSKNQIHKWTHASPGGYSVHLTKKGTLIRPS